VKYTINALNALNTLKYTTNIMKYNTNTPKCIEKHSITLVFI
jgi:hypothetical protein